MNEEIMRQLGMGDYVDKVKAGICPWCDTRVDPGSFRDELSRREFLISGLCQFCQDSVWKPQ